MVIRQLLVSSDFLSLLSPDQLAVELDAGWLEIISKPQGLAPRRIAAFTRADWRPTRAQSTFLEVLRRVVNNPPARPAV